MRIRMHRGGYAEAKQTEELIPATMTDVEDYLARHGWPEAHTNTVQVNPYSVEPSRGWDKHFIVIVEGIGPAAFTDSEVVT